MAHNSAVIVEARSAAGHPGETVSVPIVLRVRGQEVAGVQNGLTVDAALLLVANRVRRPDCRANPGINKGASSFAFRQSKGPRTDVNRTLRALILSTDNVDPIADESVLYWCSVGITADAHEGRYRLQVSGVICADPSGGQVVATAADGFVGVLAHSGTLVTRPTVHDLVDTEPPGLPSPDLIEEKRRNSAHDVFLCYNRDDQPRIRMMVDRLERRGILPWVDFREIPPGRPWQLFLEERIAQVPTAAVFVGANGIGPWQRHEIYALLSEFVERKVPVIPVLLETAANPPKLPLFLRNMHWVDFRKSELAALDELVWGITAPRS